MSYRPLDSSSDLKVLMSSKILNLALVALNLGAGLEPRLYPEMISPNPKLNCDLPGKLVQRA